jgi:signal transduction histidine kinase
MVAGNGCVYLAGQDVTERRRIADELQDFAYVASHDLAEPLRMVTAYLELLQRRYAGELDETADEFIGYAVDGAERMKAMIEALLAFSRVGTHEMERAEFDLRELLGSAVGEGVKLADDLAPVYGDPTQIAQLMHHLVDNAVKFRSPDRPLDVTVTCVKEADGTRIEVTDNGIGIAAANLDRIFKPFTRLHGRDEYEGTGIGLALCRRIAERHGGWVAVTSEPGTGSVFSVWLPS